MMENQSLLLINNFSYFSQLHLSQNMEYVVGFFSQKGEKLV